MQHFLTYDSLLQILGQVLPKDLLTYYKRSVTFKQGRLVRVKFIERKLDKESILSPTSQLATERKGYRLPMMYEFYKALKDNSTIIQNIESMKLLVLPVFYLVHGEAFDSECKQPLSYYIQTTNSQVNIRCARCKPNNWGTLNIEFKFGLLDKVEGPTLICTHPRGSIFHGLHYESTHPIKNSVLYPYAKRKLPTKQHTILNAEHCCSLLVTNDKPQVGEVECLLLQQIKRAVHP